jgi:hypothetical protein
MQHKTAQELERIAALRSDRVMTRTERLVRWAELLEKDSERRLSTLEGTEYQPSEVRDSMRSFRSPLTVAYEDPVLRTQGMTDDTYGEAKRFFQLTDWQLHDIVCHCHYGMTMTAKLAAQRIRSLVNGQERGGALNRLWEAVAW